MLMRTQLTLLACALLTSACYPTLPPQLAESTEVLAPKKVSLTFVGGGAGLADGCCGKSTSSQAVGGLETRIRVGIGNKQEIGASFFGGIGTPVGGGDIPFAAGGKLSYKVAPVSWLAFVANGGVLDVSAASTAVFGADLAAIVAPYTAADGSQLYVAARGGFAIPVVQGAHDINESIAFPIGVSLHTSDRVRLFFEGGPVMGFAQLQNDTGGPGTSSTMVGAYGVVAVSYLFR